MWSSRPDARFSSSVFRDSLVVGRRDRGRRGHGGVRHGLYGGQPASSFQNAVTVLLLDIRCSPDHYLDL